MPFIGKDCEISYPPSILDPQVKKLDFALNKGKVSAISERTYQY
jgi:hypothetical protein